jgi:hypothetical protein
VLMQYYESLLLEVKEENEREVLVLLQKLWAINSKSYRQSLIVD